MVHNEIGPACSVRIFPRVSGQPDWDPPVHGRQDPDGLTRQREHIGPAVTNDARLIYQGKVIFLYHWLFDVSDREKLIIMI